MNGDELQMMYAFLHAVLRARSSLQRGLQFHGLPDLTDYVCGLVQYPWLGAASMSQTRRERRAARARVPPRPPAPDTVLYRCDGAARGQGNRRQERQASFGAVRFLNGVVQGRCAARLGDETNNIAEYTGALVCLRDASARHARRVLIQMDSMLVVRQLRFEWRCLAASLTPLYNEALRMLRAMSDAGADVQIVHIYREFNAMADSLANEVLNRNGRPIRENWMP